MNQDDVCRFDTREPLRYSSRYQRSASVSPQLPLSEFRWLTQLHQKLRLACTLQDSCDGFEVFMTPALVSRHNPGDLH
jgi:hypothetical protein